MRPFLYKHQYYVLGVRRSGQHGIVNWLAGHYPRFLFRNDSYMEWNTGPVKRGNQGFDVYRMENEKLEVHKTNHPELGGPAVGIGVENMTQVEWDDNYPRMRDELKMVAHHNDAEQFGGRTIAIVVVRSPENHLASWINSKHGGDVREWLKLWIDIASEAVQWSDRTDWEEIDQVVPILFDRWATESYYRRMIERRLNLEMSDAGFRMLGTHGGGSSFDGGKFKDTADLMNVTERWRELDQEWTGPVLRDSELRRLRQKLFVDPSNPEQRQLLGLGAKR